MTGDAAAAKALAQPGGPDAAEVRDQVHAAADRVLALRTRQGGEDPYLLRKELWQIMDEGVGVYRQSAQLAKAAAGLAELRSRFAGVSIRDTTGVFNTNLRDAMEIGNMIELAQTVVAGAAERKESRGSHAMVEYPKRDDAHYLAHTIAYRTDGTPRISRAPVAITRWQPMERKY
jgi:succinate dehydrogenase / fumarate reductase flavoprotein subunit